MLRPLELRHDRGDVLQLTLGAEKLEEIRRIGIYLGPVVLASVVGNAVYGAVFNTTAINIGGMPLFMNLVFALVATLIAWRMQHTLGRIAWAMFALHYGIEVLMAFQGTRIGGLGVWRSWSCSPCWQLGPEHGRLLAAPC